MSYLRLKVITPKKVVLDEEVNSVTIPGADGELTILPKQRASILMQVLITF